MKDKNIKILYEAGEKWLYWGEYNMLFKYSKELEEFIIHFSQNINAENGVNVETNPIYKEISRIEERRKELRESMAFKGENGEMKTRWLRGVLLEVSNDCNLRCVYCYGQGGSYGTSRNLMNEDTLVKSLQYCFERFEPGKQISIVFFGGEPLINVSIIYKAVAMINEFAISNGNEVNYNITTNGTILNDELIDFFIRNKFRITISIDGGKEIQNTNRPFSTGADSFGVIENNINKLLENKIYPVARITLTKSNINSLVKAVKEIWELGIHSVTFETVSTNDLSLSLSTEDIELFKKQIQILSLKTYENILNNRPEKFKKIMDYVADVKNVKLGQFCSFSSQKAIVIDSKGELYKCHRMLGEKEFCVGNIDNDVNLKKFELDRNYLSVCSSCWAKNLCSRCAQENYTYTGDVMKPDPVRCELKKIVIEEGIKMYIRLSHGSNS